jgi:uncharacterized cupin superfamily protein
MIVRGHANRDEEHGSSSHGGVGDYRVRTLFQDEFGSRFAYTRELVLPAGSSIGVHEHTGDEEIYYVIAGEGVMIVDEEREKVRTGDVVLTRSGSRHGLVNDSGQDLKIFVACVTS